MTVSTRRRRRSTAVAAGVAVVSLVLAGAAAVVGGVAIYNTTDGEVQGADGGRDQLQNTPTGLLGVVGDDGAVRSLVVIALTPPDSSTDGTGAVDDDAGGASAVGEGGLLVPVPLTADVTGGFGEVRQPLAAELTADRTAGAAADNLAALAVDEVGSLLGVTLDDGALVDSAQLVELLTPLGPLTVDLPNSVAMAGGLAAGSQTLSPEAAAAVLAADDADLSATENEAVDQAVWRGIGAAIGTESAAPLALPAAAVTATASTGATDDIGAQVAALGAGPVTVTRLHARPITDLALNPDGVDVSTLDAAEVVTLFAHVAPGRVAAPNAGLNVALRSPFADDQLPDGFTRYDLVYAATSALLAAEDNVISADSAAGSAGAPTIVEVASADLTGAADSFSTIFGPVEVRVAERRIAGVDVVLILGTDYLNSVAATSARRGTAVTAPPGTDGAAPDSTNEVTQ